MIKGIIENRIDSPILQCIAEGDAQKAKELLRDGCAVICQNREGLNPLQLAKAHPVLKSDKQLLSMIKAGIFQQAAHDSDTFGDIMIGPNDEILGDIAALTTQMASLQIKASRSTLLGATDLYTLISRLKRVNESFELGFQNGDFVSYLPKRDGQDLAAIKDRTTRKLQLEPILQTEVISDLSGRPIETVLTVPNLTHMKPVRPSKPVKHSTREKLLRHIQKHDKHRIDKNTLDLRDKVVRTKLEFPAGEEMVYKEKLITKIIWVENPTINTSQVLPNGNSILILKFRDGTSDVIYTTIPLSEMDGDFLSTSKKALLHLKRLKEYTDLLHIFTEAGALFDFNHIENKRVILDWKKGFSYYYKPQSAAFYKTTHKVIAQDIVSSVKQALPTQGITLFSFGCGNGDECITINSALNAAGFSETHVIGYDIHEPNLPSSSSGAASSSSSSPAISFKRGDVNDLEQLVSASNYNPETFIIATFIGILSNCSMKGTYNALRILQQARMMDRIYVSSFTSALIDKRVLKNCGFLVEEAQSEFENGVARHFILTWMPDPERRRFLIKRGKSRSRNFQFDCLDLSFSANPLRDINLFSMVPDFKQIDLSWSYVKENEVDELMQAIYTLNQSALILIVSSHQLNFEGIRNCAAKFPNITLCERLDASGPNEIPIYLPQEAKQWGIYDKLPHRKLTI